MMQPIAMGIGETGPSHRPRGPFEPRHAAPEPAPAGPQHAGPRQKLAMALLVILMASAVAGALGAVTWDAPVGYVTFGTVLIALLWVLALRGALKRYTAEPDPPCLHMVLTPGATQGNIARMCCNAERCPLLHPEDLK